MQRPREAESNRRQTQTMYNVTYKFMFYDGKVKEKMEYQLVKCKKLVVNHEDPKP